MIVHQRRGVYAERVIHARQQLAGMHGVVERCGTGFVGLAVNIATFNAGPGRDGGETVWPVVAAIR